MVNEKRKGIVARNRQGIKSILRAIIFCGRNGLPLRGHRDDHIPQLTGHNTTEATENERVFAALMQSADKCGEEILEQHLANASSRASYTSNHTQNELLDCVLKYIQSQIVAEIQQQEIGRLFAVMADEVTCR